MTKMENLPKYSEETLALIQQMKEMANRMTIRLGIVMALCIVMFYLINKIH